MFANPALLSGYETANSPKNSRKNRFYATFQVKITRTNVVKLKAVTSSTTVRNQVPSEPRGIVASITAGFEVVNRQFLLVLLPLLLDIWLWLGVHLSIAPITRQLAGFFREMMLTSGSDATPNNTQALTNLLEAAGERFNFFSVLSTAPLGLPSLLSGRPAILTPFGAPATFALGNVLLYLLMQVVFVMAGVWVGALYFGMIAQQVRDGRFNFRELVTRVWADWLRLLIVLALALVLIFLIGAPTFVIASVASAFNPLLGYLILVVVGTGLLWVLIFGGFAPHGIVLQKRGLFGGLLDSLRLVQSNLPQTASLFATLTLINLGLSTLWGLPADASWLLLLGISGHAIVATATVTATFVFYQDRYRWWQAMQKTTTTAHTARRS